MINKLFSRIFLLLFLFASGCGIANDEVYDEKELKEKLTQILPKEIDLISVEKTEMKGFFEVNFEGIEPLYVSSNGNYLVSGDIYLITTEGLVNKSEARRDYQRKTLINNLNTEEFITFEPEETLHNIYVFTDVDCGYCRQFHNQIDDYLNLGIKVNYLAYPRAGINSDSFNKISSAWCNEDPNYSLTLLKQGKNIDTKACKDNPVEKHFNLGNAIGCLLYTSPSPRDGLLSRMPSSA